MGAPCLTPASTEGLASRRERHAGINWRWRGKRSRCCSLGRVVVLMAFLQSRLFHKNSALVPNADAGAASSSSLLPPAPTVRASHLCFHVDTRRGNSAKWNVTLRCECDATRTAPCRRLNYCSCSVQRTPLITMAEQVRRHQFSLLIPPHASRLQRAHAPGGVHALLTVENNTVTAANHARVWGNLDLGQRFIQTQYSGACLFSPVLLLPCQ